MKPVLLIFFGLLLSLQGEDASSLARRAAELLIAGKPEEAIPIYEELAHTLPNDAGILLNLSIAEFKARRYSDAAAHASAVLKLQPDSVGANLFLGSSYEELGEHAKAVGPLEKVLVAQPQERNARLMLAEALLNLERYDQAEAQFRDAQPLAPENPKVWYGLGRAYEALSTKVLNELEHESPDSPYRHMLEGDLYLKQRRYGRAFSHYQLALQSRGDLTGVHAGLATVYERTGHSAWAKVEDQREQETRPDCRMGGLACDFVEHRFQELIQASRSSTAPESRYWAYRAYTELAHEAYERLLRLPPSLEAHLCKAKTLDQAGLAGEAAAEWREALRLVPDDVRIETAFVWSLFRAHEFGALLPILADLTKRERISRDLNFLYGATFLNLEQPEKAIESLETAIRLDDKFLPAHAALGQALLQTGKPQLAIPHLRAALAGDEDGSTHFRLFRAYQLTGRTVLATQAKAEYQRALETLETKERLEELGTSTAP